MEHQALAYQVVVVLAVAYIPLERVAAGDYNYSYAADLEQVVEEVHDLAGMAVDHQVAQAEALQGLEAVSLEAKNLHSEHYQQ